MEGLVTLDHGSGGGKMDELVSMIRSIMGDAPGWMGSMDDGAYKETSSMGKKLVFTTDSYIQSPYIFPGGDIGKLSVTGTMNDLSVMGADPVGLSMSLVIEEGFPLDDLSTLIRSARDACDKAGVPVVTGDTKVMPKGQIDGIVINVSGIGSCDNIIRNGGMAPGDKIIVTGTVGDHGASVLASRFGYDTGLVSDCECVHPLMCKLEGNVKASKDPTRGGLAACINEMAGKAGVRVDLVMDDIPIKKESGAVCDALGIDILSLASEGRVLMAVAPKDERLVLDVLKEKYPDACTIGCAREGSGVYIDTGFGIRKLHPPRGQGVPRIC